MRLGLTLWASILAALLFCGGAHARTETFATTVFQQSGGTNAANLIGNTASIATLNRGQTIGLVFAGPVTSNTITFNITSVSATTTYIWFRLGSFAGGFTNAFASGQLTPSGGATGNIYVQVTGPGPITIDTTPFDASCQSIGGCNAIVFGNSTFSAGGSTFGVSSLVAATPEPATWMMMIIAFVFVAARLKHLRWSENGKAPRPVASKPALSPWRQGGLTPA